MRQILEEKPLETAVERMSRVDTAWFRMDTEANLMQIVGVWLLEPKLALDALVERVQATLLQYRRFRQKVVEDAIGANWVDDEAFDIRRHVVREPLKRRRGRSALTVLKERVGELAATPLDPRHPLWQFHLVEDLDGRRSALVQRIHHCIADGIALISVMLSITDGGAAPPALVPARRKNGDWLTDALLKPLTQVALKAIELTGTGVAKSLGMIARPSQPVLGSVDLIRTGSQVVSDALAIALMADDSPTRLKGKATPGKRVAWGEPLPLDAVKVVGKALGCSINDVLLACVSGAIGEYLRAKGDDPAGKEIRAMVPINLRPPEESHDLGNRFGLVPLVLPIGIFNPVERLYSVRARMSALKTGYQPVLAFGLLAVAGLLVKPLQSALLDIFARKATAVMTNVPGPRQTLSFCGCTAKQVMFWVPQGGDIGMGVSILSYAGGVQFGLITDRKLCPDPEAIVDRFAAEFAQPGASDDAFAELVQAVYQSLETW
jgi:WS/DGAT/MGAT family acyltransferase